MLSEKGPFNECRFHFWASSKKSESTKSEKLPEEISFNNERMRRVDKFETYSENSEYRIKKIESGLGGSFSEQQKPIYKPFAFEHKQFTNV